MNRLAHFPHFLLLFLVLSLAAACSIAAPTTSIPATQAPAILAPPASPVLSTLVTSAPPQATSEPAHGWQLSTPEEQGMDSEILAQIFPEIEAEGLNLHGLLVIRNGAIILEAYLRPYDEEQKHAVFSITKSVIATLVGIALERGEISGLDQPVVDLLPEAVLTNPDPRKDQITLEHVLSMTSGLAWGESDADFRDLYYSQDWAEYVLGLPMAAEPGNRFRYCSGCSHLLSAALQKATGTNTLDYARENLFEPLGITDLYWETDRNGIPIGGWGLFLTPRDMAKLGILYLNGGSWDGKQLVPADWVAASVSEQADTRQDMDYGYQWWVYPSYGAYAALGLGGQTVFVVPDQQLVVVTTAEISDHGPIFDLIEDFVLPAIRSSGSLPPNPAAQERLHELIEAASRR